MRPISSTLCPPSCNFRRDVTESSGCGSRRIPDTLERLLEEPSGVDARLFVARLAISHGVRATGNVTGMLIQRDQNLYRRFLVSDPLCSSQSDPSALFSHPCRECPNLHTIVHGTFQR